MTRIAHFIRALSISKDNVRSYSSKKGTHFIKNEIKQIRNSKVYKKPHVMNYQDTIGKAYAKVLNKNSKKNIKYVTNDEYVMNIEDDNWLTEKAIQHAFKN